MRENIVGAVAIAPSDRKAAIVESSNRRFGLGIGRGLIDPEFPADLRTAGVVKLGKNPITTAIQTTVVAPRHHKAAPRQAHDHGFILRALDVGVDLELAAYRGASCVIALGEGTPAITITRAATVD